MGFKPCFSLWFIVFGLWLFRPESPYFLGALVIRDIFLPIATAGAIIHSLVGSTGVSVMLVKNSGVCGFRKQSSGLRVKEP